VGEGCRTATAGEAIATRAAVRRPPAHSRRRGEEAHEFGKGAA
jgi:hypothetical protein